MEKLRIYPNETFKEIKIQHPNQLRYAISNKGRLVSYTDNLIEGRLLQGVLIDGYRRFRFRFYQDDTIVLKNIFLSKIVAQYFIPKDNELQLHLLHLDRNRSNDDIKNLKWATKEEFKAHINSSPFVIQARKNLLEFNRKSDGAKLTITKVILIKKMLAKPKQTTRLKMIAKQFGVSQMQISRIKSGENWGYIKI
ncbi:MAG: hypothetical protein H7199_01660 [Burkholderiales bacterium]|nr:hypothetical protein [Flavobacterium sp.]